MYYTSNDKAELETYNDLVSQSENYDGISTTQWANVIEHKDGNQFAILANLKYPSETLSTVDTLDGWFEEELV